MKCLDILKAFCIPLLFLWLTTSCKQERKIYYQFTFEKNLEIGMESDESGNYLFSNVRDVAVDKSRNIYALDAGNQRIQKYDMSGKYLMTIGRGQGRGPGQFLAPNQLELIDSGDLYVSDPLSNRVTIFSENGDYRHSFALKERPAQMNVTKDGIIFIEAFAMFSNAGLISQFNTDGRLIRTFGEKPERSVVMTGNSGRLALNDEGDLYYSYHYPYKICKFNKDGKLLKTFSREVSSLFEPPLPPTRRDGKIIGGISQSGSIGLVVLPDGQLLNVIFTTDKREFVDLFDKDGRHLVTVEKPFEGRILSADKYWQIYVYTTMPFPKVERYRVSLKQTRNP